MVNLYDLEGRSAEDVANALGRNSGAVFMPVECWFREITIERIRRSSFQSAEQLRAAIQELIDAHDEPPSCLYGRQT